MFHDICNMILPNPYHSKVDTFFMSHTKRSFEPSMEENSYTF